MATLALKDRTAIQELTHKYALYCDTRRFDDVLELFTVNGVFDETQSGIPEVIRGRVALRSYYHQSNVPITHITHYISNHIIRAVATGKDKGTCHVHCEAILKDGCRVQVHGYYDDVYLKVRGHWRFASRVVIPLLPTDLGTFLQQAPLGA